MQGTRREEYVEFLTAYDLLDVHMDQVGARMIGFSINYRAWQDDAWHPVFRVDTSHGRLHEHRFWRRGRDHLRNVERAGFADQDRTSTCQRYLDLCHVSWDTWRTAWEALP